MNNIVIPVDVSPDIMVALNESESELKTHFQASIAIMLFQEHKLTLGKAIQMSGLSRHEFELRLSQKNIPIYNPSIDQIMQDVKKVG